MVEQVVNWFVGIFPEWVDGRIVTFLISIMPVLECRGGMIAARLFSLSVFEAFIICYIGNMLPIPFILLFIKQIFKFMKKHNILVKFIEKLEKKTEKNADKVLKFKQWGLLTFIAVPLPGTGGWTGSLFASLLNIEFRKALPVVAIGVFIADLIMCLVAYGIFSF